MSIEFKATNFDEEDLVEFLESEYVKDTNIPVHLYSVVNATIKSYNRSLAITDGNTGTLFMEGDGVFKAYGRGNPFPLVRTLEHCNALLVCVDE